MINSYQPGKIRLRVWIFQPPEILKLYTVQTLAAQACIKAKGISVGLQPRSCHMIWLGLGIK
jgi:hypothetical protein